MREQHLHNCIFLHISILTYKIFVIKQKKEIIIFVVFVCGLYYIYYPFKKKFLDIQNDTVSYQNFYDYNYLFNEYEDKFYLEIIIK
ncbi:hypothetical protein PFBG_03374 [Plasmodium falciparum 7G8]|uniref:Uncharacterized protein n=1 Tax=Plasmodium falciparum (isolate 7G8) TaxID=57266 RepID=W7F5Q9_PLAF8|nr:hypothetical protein PFBG_03374 [Plasmodium falciparum 7G8]